MLSRRSQLQKTFNNFLEDFTNGDNSKTADVRIDFDNHNKTIQQLRTENQQLKDDNRNFKKEKEKLNNDCEDLKGKNDELLGENTRLNDQNDQQHAYIKRLERKLSKHNAARAKFLEDTKSSEDGDSDLEMRQDEVEQVNDLPPFSQPGSHDLTELTRL
jgi:chromosome segregation ATPase